MKRPTDPTASSAAISGLEHALRQKRIDALDRLARQAWRGGDEPMMIRLRYEWLAATEAKEEPVEILRRRVEGCFASDREWEDAMRQKRDEGDMS